MDLVCISNLLASSLAIRAGGNTNQAYSWFRNRCLLNWGLTPRVSLYSTCLRLLKMAMEVLMPCWSGSIWRGQVCRRACRFANAPTQMVANTQMCVYVFGTPYASGTFEVTVTGELMVNVFGSPYSAGQFTSSFTMVITPSIEGIWGCTYSNASNFLPVATNEDGSCIFEMYRHGCGHQIFATVMTAPAPMASSRREVPIDSNDDGLIGSSDLLDFLTAFGIECE